MPAFADRAKVFDLEGDQVALFLSSLQKANQRLMRISLELDFLRNWPYIWKYTGTSLWRGR